MQSYSKSGCGCRKCWISGCEYLLEIVCNNLDWSTSASFAWGLKISPRHSILSIWARNPPMAGSFTSNSAKEGRLIIGEARLKTCVKVDLISLSCDNATGCASVVSLSESSLLWQQITLVPSHGRWSQQKSDVVLESSSFCIATRLDLIICKPRVVALLGYLSHDAQSPLFQPSLSL